METKLNETEAKRCIEASCPDCRGPLSEIRFDHLREYSCLVGHRYSARGLLRTHSETQEKSLLGCGREPRRNRQPGPGQRTPAGRGGTAAEADSKKIEQDVELRRILEQLEPFLTESGERSDATD
jgi:hypothetical protein